MSPGNNGDANLIKSLKEGHQEALATLYDRYSPSLFGFITRIVGNNDTAEDILQKVYVTIWNSIATYDPVKENLLTWMLRIAMHSSIYALPDIAHTGAPVKSSNIKYLNDTIALIFFKGLKLEEASGKLGIPLNTLIPTMKMAFKQQNGELPL